MHQNVLLEKCDYVANVILNREERGNSITIDMIHQLVEMFDEIENDDKIRVVVITGKGKFFCTGMDLSSESQSQIGDSLIDGEIANIGVKFFETVLSCKKPVIAKVNGPALGGGFGLIFCCDIIISIKDAWFRFSEVNHGIVPAIISAYVTPRLGNYFTKQFMITGEKLNASDAFQKGFISSIAKDMNELNDILDKYTSMIHSNGPKAIAKVKEILTKMSSKDHKDNIQYVKEVFRETVHSDEANYGIECFKTRQKPDWEKFHAKLKSKL